MIANFLKLFLFFTLLITSLKATSNDEWSEEFIEFALGGYKGDRFYPVMMNANEEPYLEVNDIFTNWIEMIGDCDIAKKHCQGSLPWSDTIYWLNLKEMQAGSNISGSKKLLLGKHDAIIKDNKIWLKYSIFNQWLPVNTSWTHYRYALSITTNYIPLEARKKKRKINRSSLNEDRLKQERIAHATAIEAKQEYGSELRIGASVEKNETTTEYAYINALSDIFKGTLTVNASSNTMSRLPEIDSYRYENYYIPHIFQMSLGYTQSKSSYIVPAYGIINGFSLSTHEGIKGGGKFEFWDIIRPHTEVDVFRNSFIIDSKITDKSGIYHLEEVNASGGDMFSFRFYYPDGKEKTRNIIIAPDQGLLLEARELSYQAAFGETDMGFLLQQTARYGLLNNFSMGGYLYFLENYHDSIAYGVDFSWRLADSLNFHYENLYANDQSFSVASLDYLGFTNQQYKLIFKKVLNGYLTTEIPFIKKNFEDNHFQFQHWLNTHGLYIYSDLERSGEQLTLFQEFNTKLHRNFSTKIISTFFDDTSSIEWNPRLLTSFDWKNQKLQADINLKNADYLMSGQLRYPYPSKDKWSLKYDFSYTAEGDYRHRLSGVWNPINGISIAASYDEESYALNLRLEHTMTTLKKGLATQNFATGRVFGTIMSPADGDGIKEPLEGVKIFAGSRSATANAQGYFVIDGLATHQKLVLDIDKNTLDLSYTVNNEINAFVLRPGSQLEINPVILHSVGMDGVYLTYEPIKGEAMIAIINKNTGSVVAEQPIEPDGFFLIEQLTPGVYDVRLSGVKYAPEGFEIDIPVGVDWLGGVEIKGKDYRAKKSALAG